MRFARMVAAATLVLWWHPPASQAQTQDEFFDDTVVHDIFLRMNPADWQRLKDHYLENTYYPVEFRWRNVLVEDVGIRSRGISSRSPVKPGFNVDFNRFEEKQEFLGMTTLKLDNNVTDASMIRERVTMLMFKRLGLPALREAHARVYLNNAYLGCFTIVENPNKNFLRRWFNDDDGYLYEYKFVPQYRFEYLGSDPGKYSPLPFQPETHESNPNPAPLEAMIRTMNQASDAEFQSKMAEFLDLKLFLAHLAVEVFLSEGDGILGENGMANFYLYRFTGKNLHQFIAWDKDSVMGEIDRQVLKNTEKNVLIRRTLAVPQLRGYFLETILKLAALAGGPDGWLAREVAKEYNQIREAVRSDNIKPCTEDVTKPCALDRSNQLFEQSIAYVKAFANGRSAFVLRDVANAGFELSSAGPRLADRGALNAATNVVGGAIAPGSYVSVYGERLDGAAQVTPKPLGPGVSVWMNGFPAPLAYVSAGIVNVVAPWELVPGAIPVTAIVDGSISNTITADVAAYSPGVFAITHADYSAVTAGNPATGGEVLLLFANGLGPVTVDMTTGRGAPGGPFAETKEKPKVTFAGLDGEVQFSGLVPGVLALYQINVQLPASVPAGTDTPVIVSIGGQSAPPSPIATR